MKAVKAEVALHRLSFLIGEWRGTGTMIMPDPPQQNVDYELRTIVKFSPKQDQIFLVEFSDNPKTEAMFHGEQSFLYIEPGAGELRIRRHWLPDSQTQGWVSIERITVSDDGKHIGFTSIGSEGTPGGFNHKATIRKLSESEFEREGEVTFGRKAYPYKEKLVRRVRPRR